MWCYSIDNNNKQLVIIKLILQFRARRNCACVVDGYRLLQRSRRTGMKPRASLQCVIVSRIPVWEIWTCCQSICCEAAWALLSLMGTMLGWNFERLCIFILIFEWKNAEFNRELRPFCTVLKFQVDRFSVKDYIARSNGECKFICETWIIAAAPCLWNELPNDLREPRQTQSPALSPITHGSSSSSPSSLSPLASSLTRSVFHSELKTWFFSKYFPP